MDNLNPSVALADAADVCASAAASAEHDIPAEAHRHPANGRPADISGQPSTAPARALSERRGLAAAGLLVISHVPWAEDRTQPHAFSFGPCNVHQHCPAMLAADAPAASGSLTELADWE